MKYLIEIPDSVPKVKAVVKINIIRAKLEDIGGTIREFGATNGVRTIVTPYVPYGDTPPTRKTAIVDPPKKDKLLAGFGSGGIQDLRLDALSRMGDN